MGLFDNYADHTHFTSAKEFLNFIRRSHDFWWNGNHCPWVFRGQWDADWPLQPAAFRPSRTNQLRPLFKRVYERMTQTGGWGGDDTLLTILRLQFFTEIEALTQFADLARDIGMPVPRGQASILKGDISRLESGRSPSLPRENNYYDHYCPDVRLMPIAQHHGVPTRFLDFSTNPILATYFAVGLPFRPKQTKSSTHIALHAFNTGSWLLKDFLKNLVVVDGIDGITESDDFIRSQGGQFVFIKHAADYYKETAAWPSVESVLAIESARIEANPDELKRFNLLETREPTSLLTRKITLPVCEVPSLLKTLEREGASLAHLMPTLDNVARTVIHRWNHYV